MRKPLLAVPGREQWIMAAAASLGLMIFTVDLVLELGVAAGFLYLAVVTVASFSNQPRLIGLTTTVCTLLIVAGFYLSPEGGETWKVLMNRGLAIFAIWITTFLCLRANRAHRQLLEREQELRVTNRELEDHVARRIAAAEQLGSLVTASRELVSAASLEDTLQLTALHARKLIGTCEAAVYTEPDQHGRRPAPAFDVSGEYASVAGLPGAGLGADRAGCSLASAGNHRLSETQPELPLDGGSETGRQDEQLSDQDLLAAPLVSRDGRSLGLIQLSGKHAGEFDEADEAILAQFSQMAALVVELREAHDLLERRVEERTRALADANQSLQRITEELRERQQRIALLLDSTAEAIFGLDNDGNCTFCNAACLRMLGFDHSSELLGKNMHQLIHHKRPDGRPYPSRDCPIQQAVRQGQGAHTNDELLWRKDGSSFPAEYWAYPIEEQGRLVGAVVTFLDITARKEVEAHFQSVVRTAADGIITTDDQGVIASFNPAAEQIFGYAAADVVGQSVRGLIPALIADEPDRSGARFLAQVDADCEIEGRGKDGSTFPIELSVSSVELSNRTMYAAIVRDISERKAAEREISLKNRDLETLLYVTSHDLREPLRAIQNFSSMVADEYREQIDEEGQDLLRRIVRAADRMDGLIDDILVLSRAQRLELPKSTVNAKAIVSDVLDRLEESIRATHAEVQIADSFPEVVADKTWAAQAIFNLVANALKFTDQGAKPNIEIAPYTQTAARRRQNEVGIVVRDRGPGVAAEHGERIFNLFQRAVGREIQGTGAGLAIVKQVAERHGGRAWVQPRTGGGSEFIITFGQGAAL